MRNATKKFLFPISILFLILVLLTFLGQPWLDIWLAIRGPLISGLVISACIGLAEMDLHKIGDLFRIN